MKKLFAIILVLLLLLGIAPMVWADEADDRFLNDWIDEPAFTDSSVAPWDSPLNSADPDIYSVTPSQEALNSYEGVDVQSILTSEGGEDDVAGLLRRSDEAKVKADEAYAKALELENKISDADNLEERDFLRGEADAYNELGNRYMNDSGLLSDLAVDIDGANFFSLLPATSLSVEQCKVKMNVVNNPSSNSRELVAGRDAYGRIILGCAIKTGDVKLWMLPYFVRHILEFIIRIGGLVAVGGIVYGGYYYMFGGLIDDKERGKKALLYALAGIAVMSMAWAFVNIVVSFLIS